MSEVKIPNDYDPGLLNGWGGGVVDWWMDYIRTEIGCCNEWWRSQWPSLTVSPWIKVSDQEPPKDKLLLVRYDATDYDDEWGEGPWSTRYYEGRGWKLHSNYYIINIPFYEWMLIPN